MSCSRALRRGPGEPRHSLVHRFVVPKDAFEGGAVLLPRGASQQIRRVLRLRVGDTVVVFDGTGREHTARITALNGEGVRGEVIDTRTPGTEPSTRVTVCIAIVKSDRLEMAFEKCTEMGAARFVPLITDRVQGGAAAAPSTRRLARWSRIVQEAAEQSGRLVVPEVTSPMQLLEAVSATVAEGPALLMYEGEEGPGIGRALSGLRPAALGLIVGPVGGFAATEVDAAVQAGANVVSLGRRVLRSETAAIAGLAAAMSSLGELGS